MNGGRIKFKSKILKLPLSVTLIKFSTLLEAQLFCEIEINWNLLLLDRKKVED